LKLVADENIDRQIVDRLRHEGHEVSYVAEFDPGLPDPEVLLMGRTAGALLLTADKDFGERVFRRKLAHSGVLLIRLAGLAPEDKANAVSTAIQRHGLEFNRRFSVLTETALRIRR
jgi:predicted nuclease of predicted toxin-antitoxin system